MKISFKEVQRLMKKRDIKLTDFKMHTEKVDLSGTPGTKYKWTDDGKDVAEFTTFEWWDGKNIENLKVYDEYKKLGLSYKLLDYAVKKLNCKSLTVKKNNTIAKHVYDKYGFKTTEEDDDNYYMSIGSSIKHGSIKSYDLKYHSAKGKK